MDVREAVQQLQAMGSEEVRESLTRYGIPNDNALGISMRDLKKLAKSLGRTHELAEQLWETGYYEARTLAAFIDEPARVSPAQMERWAHDFDSWAICDTVCFHLFDRTDHAWEKAAEWAEVDEEFVRRAAFALLWALSVHDKQASDEQFVEALHLLRDARPDNRPLVNKAMDMALRAVGKRNDTLRRAAIDTAEELARAPEEGRSWIGRHALRELTK